MGLWQQGNGIAHAGSNMELVIRSKNMQPLPTCLVATLCEKIRDSNIPMGVELRDWACLPEGFHKQILMYHEVLFDNRE